MKTRRQEWMLVCVCRGVGVEMGTDARWEESGFRVWDRRAGAGWLGKTSPCESPSSASREAGSFCPGAGHANSYNMGHFEKCK